MKRLLISLLLLLPATGFCQMQEFTVRDFYREIERIIQEADEAIPADSDPYGFHLSVRIVSKYDGSFADIFAPETIKQSVNRLLKKAQFRTV